MFDPFVGGFHGVHHHRSAAVHGHLWCVLAGVPHHTGRSQHLHSVSAGNGNVPPALRCFEVKADQLKKNSDSFNFQFWSNVPKLRSDQRILGPAKVSFSSLDNPSIFSFREKSLVDPQLLFQAESDFLAFKKSFKAALIKK